MSGRKPKEIDREAFEKLCALFCTKEDIAHFFDCSVNTVDRWCKRTYKRPFCEVFAIKSIPGKIRLREAQFKLAERYPMMAIFLGKNYLGQRDYKAIEIEDADGKLEKIDAILDMIGGVV